MRAHHWTTVLRPLSSTGHSAGVSWPKTRPAEAANAAKPKIALIVNEAVPGGRSRMWPKKELPENGRGSTSFYLQQKSP